LRSHRRAAAAVAAGFLFLMPGAAAEEAIQRTNPPAERPAAEESREMLVDGRPLRIKPAEADPAAYQWHGAFAEELEIAAPEGNVLVKKYIEQYTTPAGKKWLETVMRRGEPYLPFIRTMIAERGLPPELAYLPVIESGYLPTAVSKSGAVGLWQFMRNSVAPFGIRINDWTDERRDFWKATDGALRKLKENHGQLGDWPLALAAYNAGLGAVGRAVKVSGTRDYWALSERKALKTETIHYVPKFIAVATILSQPVKYGIDLGWPEDARWTRVPVGKTVDLGMLAEQAKVPVESLRAGNPELRYGVTPPETNYFLKVREEHATAVAATLARKDLQLLKYYFHVVRSGDTLSALSRHYGVSVELIERSNPGLSARYLKIGSRILVPALKDVGPYKPDRAGSVAVVFDGQYLVKKGETLWSIALAFDVDPELLAEANGMELSSVLREGRVLKTPILKEDR
jgi:membrane-bound lytic murein transglycosylase D